LFYRFPTILVLVLKLLIYIQLKSKAYKQISNSNTLYLFTIFINVKIHLFYWISLGIVMCLPVTLEGQQEVTFSQYMFNHQSLNPAYAGSKDYTHFAIIQRTQWSNFPGAPESQAFTFNNKMSQKKFGFGLAGVNDKIGPMSSSRVALDLAYHLPIKDAFLAIGIKAGISNFDFDESIIQTTTPDDMSFTFDEGGKFTPNIGFGIYYHRPRWYAGFSIPWFIENESLTIQKHDYGIVGGLVRITDDFQAKPSMLVKHTKGSAFGYDLSVLLLYRELFWIGPQTRSSFNQDVPGTKFGGGFGMIAGVHLGKSISVGYSYNTSSLGKLINVNHATHEFMLRFDLIPVAKSMLRSPRIF
jgi:type IX secretion system PorP/SprF family membrane protein